MKTPAHCLTLKNKCVCSVLVLHFHTANGLWGVVQVCTHITFPLSNRKAKKYQTSL